MDHPHDILAPLPDSEPIESNFRNVETKSMLDGGTWGTHVRTGTTIIPGGNLSWTLLRIIILLNELDDTWSRGATARVLQSGSRRDDPGPYVRFLFECEGTTLEQWLNSKFISAIGVQKSKHRGSGILIEWEHDSTMIC
jgi:hypothetical protein